MTAARPADHLTSRPRARNSENVASFSTATIVPPRNGSKPGRRRQSSQAKSQVAASTP
jgi:hypothetical protein